MAKAKTDDEIFSAAKTKIGKLITEASDPQVVVSLVNALTKMKAVELKMGEEDWGKGLGGGADT